MCCMKKQRKKMDKKIRAISMSTHPNFFSSIKQVEKRLKLDKKSERVTKCEIEERTLISRGECLSLSSPMFLNLEQEKPSGSKNCTNQDSSEAPQGFLSISQGFPLTNQDPSQATSASNHLRIVDEGEEDVDEIELLMQLLGISSEEEERDGFEDCDSCHCEGGFYSKIVGVKGPKCEKEVVRLDGWIKHFMNGNGNGNGNGDGVEKQEPLRLAHLLLGKAAFISDAAFGGLDFPSTIQEFLHTDPPTH